MRHVWTMACVTRRLLPWLEFYAALLTGLAGYGCRVSTTL